MDSEVCVWASQALIGEMSVWLSPRFPGRSRRSERAVYWGTAEKLIFFAIAKLWVSVRCP